jgi:NADH-quinone oxidoreductase subunit J
MTAADYVFWVVAILTVGSAAVVVLARSLIYNAFALLFTFFGVAGLYVLLGADFLAAAQLLVYVGGIMVLLLFGVMLTHRINDLDLRTETTQLVPGLIVGLGLFTIVSAVAFKTRWPGAVRSLAPTTSDIGRMFLNEYLLAFEAASILLLVALIGAAMIVRRKKDA